MGVTAMSLFVLPSCCRDEDCLAMYKAPDYKWVDIGCEAEFYFICEKNKQGNENNQQGSP